MDVTQPDDLVPSQEPQARHIALVLFSGEAGTRNAARIPLSPGQISIGRDVHGSHDLCLDGDSKASRVHCVMHVPHGEGPVAIEDAGSRNGSFVNGQRLGAGKLPLADGDIVRIGSSFLLLRREIDALSDAPTPFLVGESLVMRKLRRLIQLVAKADARVLITGATGSGKEAVARALHGMSKRQAMSFVPVNCAAIPATLAESLLFGHTGNAFSGAGSKASSGFFQAAQFGTLFLDEIGEMPLELQPKLLRVLEERRVYPVGNSVGAPCDVRVLSATNRELTGEIAAGRFRGDLYARLYGIELRVPALRERREDILLLCEHYLGSRGRLSPRLVEALLLYDWPYNVRELCLLVEQLQAVGVHGSILEPELIAGRLPMRDRTAAASAVKPAAPAPLPVETPASAVAVAPETSEQQARPVVPPPDLESLRHVLELCRGNVLRAARMLGASRYQIYRWLNHYGIELASFRRPAVDSRD